MTITQFKQRLGAILHPVLANRAKGLYAVILSKHKSVTPERHSGFFAPVIRSCSQHEEFKGVSVTATQTRLQSLYEGMTSQNKPAMANMWGGSFVPRVNPLTNIFIGEISNTQHTKGGSHA